MSLHILHVTTPLRSSPFLSAHAANVEWLPDALRERGHKVTVWTADDPLAKAATAQPGQFDVVHVHTDAPGGDAGTATVPTLVTRYPDIVPTAHPWIALSNAQVRLADRLPAAVIAPALEADALDLRSTSTGDELVSAFDGSDIYTLRSVLAVARHCERPLTLIVPAGARLTVEASDLIDRAEAILRVVDADAFWSGDGLAGSACYLSFERRSFDMGALSALGGAVPVVTFDGFPASELIVHGESGFAVRSVEDACRAVESLSLLRPALGRARAKTLFGAASAAIQHESVYEQLTRGELPVFRHPETGPNDRVGRELTVTAA